MRSHSSCTAFDVDASHCNGIYPSDKLGDNAACFQHSWASIEARNRLWSACSSKAGREVSRIFVSDIRNRIRYDVDGVTSNYAGYNSDGVCDPELLTLIEEAHTRNVDVYGLFASSDAAFSEQGMVVGLKNFNTVCGTTNAYFDGASVNNEHFTSIKTCNDAGKEAEQITFHDNLEATRANAAPLPLHFSVSWNWDCCSCSSTNYLPRNLTWNGNSKTALEHMLDIADSVDVQVAWNVGSTMANRAQRPYVYWDANRRTSTTTTAFYILAYTNPNSDCRLSFSPQTKGAADYDSCTTVS